MWVDNLQLESEQYGTANRQPTSGVETSEIKTAEASQGDKPDAISMEQWFSKNDAGVEDKGVDGRGEAIEFEGEKLKPLQESRELVQAREKIEELKESWAWERAEFVNFRKRTVQEKERHANDALAGFVQALLPTLDDFDQLLSMEIQNEEVRKYVAGVSIIRDNFVNILKEKQILVIYPLNEEFDPQTMEAIASEERADLDKETVLEVYQRGYLIKTNGEQQQLIRAARVRVGKPRSKIKNDSLVILQMEYLYEVENII